MGGYADEETLLKYDLGECLGDQYQFSNACNEVIQ